MCKLVEDYANMRAAEEAQKPKGSRGNDKRNSPQGICNGTVDRKCGTAGKAFNRTVKYNITGNSFCTIDRYVRH